MVIILEIEGSDLTCMKVTNLDALTPDCLACMHFATNQYNIAYNIPTHINSIVPQEVQYVFLLIFMRLDYVTFILSVTSAFASAAHSCFYHHFALL